jgi:hypothetical protein
MNFPLSIAKWLFLAGSGGNHTATTRLPFKLFALRGKKARRGAGECA